MPNRILIIDDDKDLCRLLQESLRQMDAEADVLSLIHISNSAIAEKEFFLIPKDYVTKGNNNENGVLKETYTENGEVTTEFIATSIYYETDDDYYIDNSILELGNNLVKPDSTDKYTISRSATLIGVYNINKGYADFKEIQLSLIHI